MAEHSTPEPDVHGDFGSDIEETNIDSYIGPPVDEIRLPNSKTSSPSGPEVSSYDDDDTFVDHRSSGKKTPKTYSHSKLRSSIEPSSQPPSTASAARRKQESGKTDDSAVHVSNDVVGQDTADDNEAEAEKSVEAASVLAVDANINTDFNIAGMPTDDAQDDQGAFSEARPSAQRSGNGGSTDPQLPTNVSGRGNNDDDDASTETSDYESNEPEDNSAESHAKLEKPHRGGKRRSSGGQSSAVVRNSEDEDDDQPPTKRSRTSGGVASDGENSADGEDGMGAESEDDGESQIPAVAAKQTSRHQNKPAPVQVDSPQEEDSESEPDFTIREKSGKTTGTSPSNKKSAPPEKAAAQEADSESEEEPATTARSTNKSRKSKPSSSAKKTPSRGRITKTPAKGTAKPSAKKTPAGAIGSPTSTPTSSSRPPNKVLFSSSALSTANKTWLKRQINVVEEIPGKKTNYAVVVRGQNVPTTIKVLRALIAGKRIVTDQWVLDSKKEGDLLDTEEYVHPDLDDDIATDARRTLFLHKTLFFTRFAEKQYGDGWNDVKKAAMEAGALAVERGAAYKGAEGQYDKDNVIFFGAENDTDAEELRAKPYERTVYDKKMFAQAIIRGKLELDDDEFVLE